MVDPAPAGRSTETVPFRPDRPALVRRLRAAGCVYAEDEADLLIAAADSPHRLADLVADVRAALDAVHAAG